MVRKQSFGASATRELHAGKRHHHYRLNGANSVAVPEGELANLVSAIAPMLAPYRASHSGAVGNGEEFPRSLYVQQEEEIETG